MFRGSSTQFYIPAFTIVKDFQSTIGVPNSSLNLIKPPRLYSHNPTTPLPKRLTTKLYHLYQRGIQTNTTPITSTEEGFTNKRRVYNLEATTTSNTLSFLFSTKNKILIDQDRRYGSSVETRCFWKQATKKNYLGNSCKRQRMKNNTNIPKSYFL